MTRRFALAVCEVAAGFGVATLAFFAAGWWWFS